MEVPSNPKIYHIVHIDRLPSILAMRELVSDVEALRMSLPGTGIGDSDIKERRRRKKLHIYPDLTVGSCVPFYFCPRSVLLLSNHSGRRRTIENRGGQEPIIHLESDLNTTVAWADWNGQRWLLTDVNATLTTATEFNELDHLERLHWDIIASDSWEGQSHVKMAEFLIEKAFPWSLVERIGVMNQSRRVQVERLIQNQVHRPRVQAIRDWYY